MLSTEKCFDMLPYAVDIFEKLDIQDFIKKNSIDVKDKLPAEIEKLKREQGIKVAMFILKNTEKIKEEVFNIVATLQGKPVSEVKNQGIGETISAFKTLMESEGLVDFFNSAM